MWRLPSEGRSGSWDPSGTCSRNQSLGAHSVYMAPHSPVLAHWLGSPASSHLPESTEDGSRLVPIPHYMAEVSRWFLEQSRGLVCRLPELHNKCHGVGGLSHGKSFPHCPGGWKSTRKVLAGFFSPWLADGCFLLSVRVIALRVPLVPLGVQMS